MANHSRVGSSSPVKSMLYFHTPHLLAISGRIRFGLFRFRSPLLTESLLLSFPLLIMMLRFSRFPCLWAHRPFLTDKIPIRRSPGRRIHTSNRSLSQFVTSFIGYQAKRSIMLHWCSELLVCPSRKDTPVYSNTISVGSARLNVSPKLHAYTRNSI